MPPTSHPVSVVDGDHVVVWLHDEVDLSAREELILVAGLMEQRGVPVTVDLSELTFADATLAAFLTRLGRTNPVRVRRASRVMRELLVLLGAELQSHPALPRQAAPAAQS